jgi:hypothetical protein
MRPLIVHVRFAEKKAARVDTSARAPLAVSLGDTELIRVVPMAPDSVCVP